MLKHFKIFDTKQDYDNYISDTSIYPNLCLCNDTSISYFNEDSRIICQYYVEDSSDGGDSGEENKIYIEDFPQDICDDEYNGDMYAFKQEYVDDLSLCNEYIYTGETFTYNNQGYYLWENSNSDQTDVAYILTSTLDFSGESLEDDLDNDICPFMFILDDSQEEIYDAQDKEDYFLVAQRGINSSPNVIYIDDFPELKWNPEDENYDESFSSLIEFKEETLMNYTDSKNFTYTGETFTYNNNTYYLWENNNQESEVDLWRYLLTETLDFSGDTLEDDINNDVCPYIYVLYSDKSVTYDALHNTDHMCIIKQTGLKQNIKLFNTFDQSAVYSNFEIDGNKIPASFIVNGLYSLSPGLHTVKFSVNTILLDGYLPLGFFLNCKNLVSVKYPKYITDLSDEFKNCTNLSNIILSKENTVYSVTPVTFSNCNSLPIKNNIQYADYILIKLIDDGSEYLYVSSIYKHTRIILLDAFVSGSDNVIFRSTFKFPKSLVRIGDNAFDSCMFNDSLNLPDNITYIGREAFYTAIFPERATLKLPENIITIGANCFTGCHFTGELKLPNTLTTALDYAFQNNNFSGTLYIPALFNIYNNSGNIPYVFYNAGDFDSIIVDSNNTKYDSRNNCNAIIMTTANRLVYGCKNTIIPNNVTQINSFAFAYINIETINIPASITYIAHETTTSPSFQYCKKLAYITVDPNNTIFDSRNDCNAIIKTADNLLIFGSKNTIIPNTVTAINSRAFLGNGISSITIPSSITEIGNYIFSDCEDLTDITIDSDTLASATYTTANNLRTKFNNKYVQNLIFGNNVTAIGNYCYNNVSTTNQTSLKTITIPDSVTSIGQYAFRYNKSLETVTIGSGITSIEQYAFNTCALLSSVTVLATTPPTLGTNAFNSNKSGRKIYVPAGSVSAYKAANNWSSYSSAIEAIPSE